MNRKQVDLVELPYDKIKNQRRAFGFITFESEDVVEKLCQNAKVPFRERSVSSIIYTLCASFFVNVHHLSVVFIKPSII